MEQCRSCLTGKDASEFHTCSKNRNKLDTKCKICRNAFNKNYRDNNKSKLKESRKRYYMKNIEKMRLVKKSQYNPETKSIYDKEYRKVNKDKIAKYKSNWELKNRNNPTFKIKRNLRRRLIHALKGNLKADKTLNLLGCSVIELKAYLEEQFQLGMSWENYGVNGWHIDHIRPCFTFDLSNIDHQKECFHYSNLRPLWGKENISRKRRTN